MPDSKSIEAAIALVNARFTFNETGQYFLNNYGNEEYISHCIGNLHRALVAEGHMPPIKQAGQS